MDPDVPLVIPEITRGASPGTRASSQTPIARHHRAGAAVADPPENRIKA